MAFVTVSFVLAPPVVKFVEEAVNVQAATTLPRWSLTVVFPSCPLAASDPALTVARGTVEAGTVMFSAPLLIVNVAIVLPDCAASAD